jgi:2,3-dihydroxy-2,3-dihydrophenylpropionate dehydrogenase
MVLYLSNSQEWHNGLVARRGRTDYRRRFGTWSGTGRTFLNEGAQVAVLQRSQSKVDELIARFGDRIVAVTGDVARYADNVRAVEATVARFGKLDCFIGNAGIWDHYADVVNMSGEQLETAFDEIMSINTKGYLLGAKAALNELLKTEGSMIFTLSNSAFYSSGGGPIYTASKHAGVGLVRELAYELALIKSVSMPSRLRA